MSKQEKKVRDKTIVIPLEHKMWASLRKIAFDNETSMSQMVRDAIEKIIIQYEKKN